MKVVEPGQRWIYTERTFQVLVEVRKDNKTSTIKQILKGGDSGFQVFQVGHIFSTYGIDKQNCSGYSWTYLENQDVAVGA